MSICVSDIPKERILVHENGKKYLSVKTYDYDTPDKFDNDFSVSISKNKDEVEKSKAGEKINRIFIGKGRIWENKEMTPLNPNEEHEDLPF